MSYPVWSSNSISFVQDGVQLARIISNGANQLLFEGAEQGVNVSMDGVATPTDGSGLASKEYVDDTIATSPTLVRTGEAPQVLAGTVFVNNGTASVSPSTGCLRLLGGLGVQGAVHCAGAVTADSHVTSSDARLKRDITPISSALDKLARVQAVEYRMKADKAQNLRYGVIAQQVAASGLGHLVKPGAAPGMLGVDYNSLIGLLVGAVNELGARVSALEAENAALRHEE